MIETTTTLDITGPIVAKAYEFAKSAHQSINQVRKYSGDPYFDAHVVEVAIITQQYMDRADWMDYQYALAGALLHDVVEDVAPINLDFGAGRILSEFGPCVSGIVEGLTDVFTGPNYKQFNRAARKLMEAARLHLAGRHPGLGGIIHTIKVADLIQNTSSIVSEDAEFAKVYLREKRDLLVLLDRADERILERAKQQIA
jgi:(p)ppGpp synthase/HD superfamily hydrolase